MMYYIGVDPGASGCIAVIDHNGRPCERLRLENKSEHEISSFLREQIENCNDREYEFIAAIEQVSSSPQMGVVSAFSFGKSYGTLLMALAANRISYVTVSPSKWQGEMNVRRASKEIKQAEHKRNLKAAAQKLWPAEKILKDDADALLIAEYARRMHKQGKI